RADVPETQPAVPRVSGQDGVAGERIGVRPEELPEGLPGDRHRADGADSGDDDAMWHGVLAVVQGRAATMATFAPPKADFVLMSVRPRAGRLWPRTTSRVQSGSRSSLLSVGGTKPPSIESTEPASSSTPAAPRVWPIIGLREFTGIASLRGPKTWRIAWHS